jgi:hypothetical protein
MTINHLPDEVILEIFDSYRRSIYEYYYWTNEYVWFKLTRVCRKWRAIMFASTSRLDLDITVRPTKRNRIKAIPSEPFPIFVRYRYYGRDMTSSDLWQLRAALKQHDRVREINFFGPSDWFDEFFRNTNCSFPILESLSLETRLFEDVKIPDTFLGGSYLHLRRLELEYNLLTSISRFLLSTSALTDLCANRYSLRYITGNVPSRLFARHALPVPPEFIHVRWSSPNPITAFDSQEYCHTLQINILPLRWSWCILRRHCGGAFGSISPGS